MNRLSSIAVLALLLFGSPVAMASAESAPVEGVSAESVSAESTPAPIVPTDGPVTSTTGTYVYDPSGNVAAVGPNSYVYDPMGRVTTGSVDRFGNVQSQTYTYDVYGNRLGDGTVSYPASTLTNRLTGSGAQYGAAGDLTQWQPPGSATARTYSYDALSTNMREKVTVSGADKYVVHIYTAADERYWDFRDNGNGNTEMRYALRDLGGRVLREYVETAISGSTVWTARDYVYRDGALLASHDSGGDTYHYSLDHLGTPRLITDQDHVKVAEHTYFPFGAEYTDSSPTDGRLHFAGHEERDADFLNETRGELDYMHARYYHPNSGRFLSVDPVIPSSTLRRPQGWNRYSYALNNPLLFVDPTGMEPCKITLPDGTEVDGECIEVKAKADRVTYLWDIFFDFLFEEGHAQRLYSGRDFQTADIARSPGADQMREDFEKGGCRSSSLQPRFYPGSYDSMVAYKETLANGSFVDNPIAAQVGGFSYRFDRLTDGRVMYTAANQLSAWSLAYHIPGIPHKQRGGPVPFMGNVDERFRWVEDVPPGCK